MTLILTASAPESLADMQAAIAAIEQGFDDIACGTARQPGPTSLHLLLSDIPANGAGALAVTYAEAVLMVLPIAVLVWSRNPATVETFRARTTHHAVRVIAASSIREVVEAADALCTLTPSVEPVVHGEWFRSGLHINAVGARPRPTHREIDCAGMGRSDVFADNLETAVEKSGDLLTAVSEGAMSISDVRGELGAVIAGQLTGRSNEEDITLFNSVGIGMQDLVVGCLLFDAAVRHGYGTHINMAR